MHVTWRGWTPLGRHSPPASACTWISWTRWHSTLAHAQPSPRLWRERCSAFEPSSCSATRASRRGGGQLLDVSERDRLASGGTGPGRGGVERVALDELPIRRARPIRYRGSFLREPGCFHSTDRRAAWLE